MFQSGSVPLDRTVVQFASRHPLQRVDLFLIYKLSWPKDAIRISKEPKVVERHRRICLRGITGSKYIQSMFPVREGIF